MIVFTRTSILLRVILDTDCQDISTWCPDGMVKMGIAREVFDDGMGGSYSNFKPWEKLVIKVTE